MSSRLIDSLESTGELAELFSDGSVLSAMLQFETALARAQAALRMIPPGAAETIARVTAADLDAAAIAREARQSASVAIPFVKALTVRVEAIDPAAATYVHWGTTSQDVLDTSLVLLLRRARQVLSADAARLEHALRTLSEHHAGTVMLARTVLQPAPPTTFGYKAAAWYGAVHRSWRRLSQSFDEALQVQLGGAAGTLAAYQDRGPALAATLAKQLDLGVPDAPWGAHRDRLAAVLVHCGIYTGSLAKIARDVALLMQAEVGEVAEPGGDSSAMPHKRNPAGSVVALAAAVRVPGMVASYLSGMVQEHERAAGGWQAEWPAVAGIIQATGSALAAVAEAIAGLTVNPDRMRANLDAARGAVFAEKAAMLLAPKLGRAAAQALVADALKGPHLRDGLTGLPAGQLEKIDEPEDYLGATEVFRRRLLESQDS